MSDLARDFVTELSCFAPSPSVLASGFNLSRGPRQHLSTSGALNMEH